MRVVVLCGPPALALLAVGCAPGVELDPGDGGSDGAMADAASDAAFQDCAHLWMDLSAPLPDVILLLDHSVSMLGRLGHGGTPRWDVLVDALMDPPTGLATRLAPHLTLGAAVYDAPFADPAAPRQDSPWCPVVNGVMPAPDNLEPIQELLDLVGTPVGGTPTAEALLSVVSGLVDGGEPPPGGRVLLLVTDLGTGGCGGVDATRGTIVAAGDAFAAGVRVHVLALDVWDHPWSDRLIYLQRLANAGVGLEPEGPGNAPFFFANEPGDIRLELGRLLSTAARSCILPVEGTIELRQADEAAVEVAGSELRYGDPDGWRVVDEHTIELLGAGCDELLSARQGALTVSFPCEVF